MLAAAHLFADTLAMIVDNIASFPDSLMNALLEGFAIVFDAIAVTLSNAGLGVVGGAFSNAAATLRSAQTEIEQTSLGNSLREAGDAAAAMSPDLGAMADAVRNVTDLTYEQALADGQRLALEKEISESLTNVPSGFKVALERFRAIDPNLGSPSRFDAEGLAGQQQERQVSIENIFLASDNPQEFLNEMERIAERARQEQAGGITGQQLPVGGNF